MHGFDSQLSLVLATDLSERSDRAFDRALRLAREHRALLTIVYVIDNALPAEIGQRLHREAMDFINHQIDASKIKGHADIQVRLVRGRVHQTIIEQAKDTHAHLIILGIHRADALIDTFRGTTVERVVRLGDRSILVVKKKPMRAYRNIVVGTDLSQPSRYALELALRLFPHADVTVLHITSAPIARSMRRHKALADLGAQHQAQLLSMIEDVSAEMSRELEIKEFKLKASMEEGETVSVILRRVDAQRPDLLVVGTHGRSGVKRSMLGSVAERLLSVAPCDVLAVRARLEE